MKKILATICVLSLIVFTQCQKSETESIRETFEKYFTYVENQDNEKMLDYVYPKLFLEIPRSSIANNLAEMMRDSSMRYHVGDCVVNKVTEPITVNKVKYSLITYTYLMNCRFNDVTGPDADEQGTARDRATYMYEVYKEKYGEKNVTYDSTANTVKAKINAEIYAIEENKEDGWKFLEKREDLKLFLDKLLPKEILDKL